MSDENNNKDDFADDFADDFSDDFGDDFSDELSEDSVGFDDSSGGDDFSDETVVYDDDVAGGSAAFASNDNPMAEYKKYIVMAFTITMGIIFLVMMMGKKKKKPEMETPEPVPMFADQGGASASEPSMSSLQGPSIPKPPVNKLDQLAQQQPAPMPVMPAPEPVNSDQLSKIYQETKVMSERLSSVQAQFQSNRTNFGQLTSTLSTLERSVRQANAALTQLQDNMSGLKAELKKQHTVIQTLKKKRSTTASKDYKGSMEMVKTPQYHLYAAIPGRAWLKSQSGTTLTIAVGSNVPGYGRVTLIEPIKGMVITNKGYIFKFAER